eukprot:scaffold76419_cov27-Phaeocystis_antarctica.AAC.1
MTPSTSKKSTFIVVQPRTAHSVVRPRTKGYLGSMKTLKFAFAWQGVNGGHKAGRGSEAAGASASWVAMLALAWLKLRVRGLHGVPESDARSAMPLCVRSAY